MNKTEFLEAITELLEVEDTVLTLETKVDDLEEWDSLATLSIIAFADSSFNVKLTGDKISTVNKINDLALLVGLEFV